MFIVEGSVPEQQAVGRHFAAQVFLRQRWPLVRQTGFIADQHQTAAEALAPQGIDSLRAGLAAAYDEDGGDHRIPWKPTYVRARPHMPVPVAYNRTSIVATAQG